MEDLLQGKSIHWLMCLPIQHVFTLLENKLSNKIDVVLPSPTIVWLGREMIRQAAINSGARGSQEEGPLNWVWWGQGRGLAEGKEQGHGA